MACMSYHKHIVRSLKFVLARELPPAQNDLMKLRRVGKLG